MSTLSEFEPRDRDDLASYFDRSAFVVHSYAERIEHGFVRPAIKTAKEVFHEYPVPSVFLCFFAILSIFPIILFVFCSAVVTLSFIVFAISSALFASASIVFTFSCLLLLGLLINLCIALFPTVILFWGYTVFRLFTLSKSKGRAGAAEWVDETKTFLAGSLGSKTKDHGSPTPSNDSIVIVDGRSNEKQEDSVSKVEDEHQELE